MLVTLPNAFGDAITNMAVDAALLHTVPAGTATFRHYGWTEPAFTFGYSQHFAAVLNTLPEGAQSCRRMSGGGIVDHRNDWTYALHLHRNTACAQITPTALYARIHEAVVEALRALGQESQLAPCPKQCATEVPLPDNPQPGPDACFLQPVMNDVISPTGRKIAGAAIKRGRDCLLIQGSIDRGALPADFDFIGLASRFPITLAYLLKLECSQEEDFRPYFARALIDQEKARFGSAEWTRRR